MLPALEQFFDNLLKNEPSSLSRNLINVQYYFSYVGNYQENKQLIKRKGIGFFQICNMHTFSVHCNYFIFENK